MKDEGHYSQSSINQEQPLLNRNHSYETGSNTEDPIGFSWLENYLISDSYDQLIIAKKKGADINVKEIYNV